jgi:hypothetical protein
MRPRWPAVWASEPPSSFVDPDRRIARTIWRSQPIANLKERAPSEVDGLGAKDDFMARGFAVMRQEFGEIASGAHGVERDSKD